jgi:hypothetical protein
MREDRGRNGEKRMIRRMRRKPCKSVKVKKMLELEVNGLGSAIRKARGQRTISEVASLANISRKAWHEIEAEIAPAVMLETLQRMEKALGTSFGVHL